VSRRVAWQPDLGKKSKLAFSDIGKKKEKEASPPTVPKAAEPEPPTPTLKGQRKRRGDQNGDTLGHCRSGRLLGAIQYLTAVVREKPELAPMLFRASVAKVLVNRLATQLLTSSAVVLNNVLPTTDPLLLADAVKAYLKQQPNPLIEYDFYEPVIKIVSKSTDSADAAAKIASLFKDNTSGNDTTELKTVFAFLSELLKMVEGDAEATKLLPYTLGPVLMWPEEPPSTLEGMALLKNVPKAAGIIMSNYKLIFEPLGHGQPENEPTGLADPAKEKGAPPPPPDEEGGGGAGGGGGGAASAEAEAAAAEQRRLAQEEAKAAAAAAAAEATAAAEAKAEAKLKSEAAKAKAAADASAALIAQQAEELEKLKAAQAVELAGMDEKDREAALVRMQEEKAEALARMARLKPQSLSQAILVALDLVPEYLHDCREALQEVRRRQAGGGGGGGGCCW
jgi:hypothetical protein